MNLSETFLLIFSLACPLTAAAQTKLISEMYSDRESWKYRDSIPNPERTVGWRAPDKDISQEYWENGILNSVFVTAACSEYDVRHCRFYPQKRMVDLSVCADSGDNHMITFWTDWYQPINKNGGDSSIYEDGLDCAFANDTITTTFSGGCSGLINFTPENFSFGIKGEDVADVRFRTKFHYSLEQVYVFSSRGEGFEERIADIWTPWTNTYIGKEQTGWRYRLFCMDTLQFDRRTFEGLKEKAQKTNQFVFYDKADSLRYDNPNPMSSRMYTYFIPYVREHFHVDYETADNLGDLSINIWMGDFITEIEIIFRDGSRKTLIHRAKHIFGVA